jgi:hypothetical protein
VVLLLCLSSQLKRHVVRIGDLVRGDHLQFAFLNSVRRGSDSFANAAESHSLLARRKRRPSRLKAGPSTWGAERATARERITLDPEAIRDAGQGMN